MVAGILSSYVTIQHLLLVLENIYRQKERQFFPSAKIFVCVKSWLGIWLITLLLPLLLRPLSFI